jgi:hypothetical protein
MKMEYTLVRFMPCFLCMVIDLPFNLLTADDGLSVGHGGPAPFAFANLLLAAAVSDSLELPAAHLWQSMCSSDLNNVLIYICYLRSSSPGVHLQFIIDRHLGMKRCSCMH